MIASVMAASVTCPMNDSCPLIVVIYPLGNRFPHPGMKSGERMNQNITRMRNRTRSWISAVLEIVQCGAVITRSTCSQTNPKGIPRIRSLRWDMRWLLLVQTLKCITPHSLKWCMRYHVILDSVLTAPDCITKTLIHGNALCITVPFWGNPFPWKRVRDAALSYFYIVRLKKLMNKQELIAMSEQ